MASEATWADAWRSDGHRETAQWHFVDTELDGSANEDAACFNHPAAAVPASAGPEQDCVVDKIDEFTAELKAPATDPAERLLALKYLLHFVGDVHQPLHAADNHDRGGNCVLVLLGTTRTANLHAIWDTGLVEGIGTNPTKVATMLNAAITPAQVAAWQKGNAAAWAQESFAIAKAVAYPPRTPTRCGAGESPIELPKGYAPPATRAVAVQLAKAGVRLAWMLNGALGGPETVSSPIVEQSGKRGG
ncbi:MAG: S1/P1 nuclease [Janthinobacterium lividum]